MMIERLSLVTLISCSGLATAQVTGEDATADAERAIETTRDAPGGTLPDHLRFAISELGNEMARLADEGDFSSAAALGEVLLALSLGAFGSESPDLADAYVRVADVQSRNAQYDEAELNALNALDIIRETQSLYSESLIEPLLILGDNYQRSGDQLSALSIYEEAQTVVRRAYGLHDERQIEILHRASESYLRLNQFIEARSARLEALDLVSRSSAEPGSLEELDATFDYALWLRENNRFSQERALYYQMDLVVQDRYSPDSVLRVRILQERANSFRAQGAHDRRGIAGLREALAILEAQEETDRLRIAELLRDIGDWETVFADTGIVEDPYLDAWRMLGELENGDTLRSRWFEPTVLVFAAGLSQRGLSHDPEDPRGYALLHFDVDRAGRPDNIVVVESTPPGFIDDAAIRQVEESRFRPAVADGRLTPRRRAMRIEFRYPSDARR